ncbi:MAG: hypothetical protein R3F49_03390 [Planctomycetota bacterium]
MSPHDRRDAAQGAAAHSVAPLATPGFTLQEHGQRGNIPAFCATRGEALALELPGGIDADHVGACLMGFAPLASGAITLFGSDVARAPRERLLQHRRRVAHAPQRPAFLSTVTIPDNVAIPLRDRWQLPEQEVSAAVERKLRALSVTIVGRVLPSQLAPRARYLAGLARALLAAPELLLVALPDPRLPPQIEEAVRSELMAAVRDGAALVLIGHGDTRQYCPDATVHTAEALRDDAAPEDAPRALAGPTPLAQEGQEDIDT